MIKDKLNYISKVITVFLIMFSCVFGNLMMVNAASATVVYNGKVTWSGSTVGNFTVNGKQAFCLEHAKTTPPTGTALTTEIYQNEMVKKVLYFGWAGPGQWSGFDGNANKGIVITSLALDVVYSGGNSKLVNDFMSYISDKTVPGRNAQFSSNYENAFVSGEVQRTNVITLNGDMGASATFTLPNNVQMIKNGTIYNGQVTVEAGQSFYLQAPMTVTGTYSTGTVGEGFKYQSILCKTGNNSMQDLGYGEVVTDPAGSTRLDVKWLELGNLEITKSNVNNDLIDGAKFRLTSVSYNGYDEVLTIENGKLLVRNIPAGKYNLQEISAPDGYLIDEEIYSVDINAGRTTRKVVINEEPLGEINLVKEIDAKKTKGLTGDAYLHGNEYTLYAKEDITNKAGTKTYFKKGDTVDRQITNKNGEVKFNNLHIGQYQIRETKSNDSLMLNTEVIDINIEYGGQNVSKVIKSNKTNNRVNMQKIQVFKSGEKDGISGIVKGLQGAEFTFHLKSEVDHVGWDNAKDYAVITTDEAGKANTPYMPYGTYLVKETKTPEGYITAPDFIVSVTNDYSEYIDVEQIKRINVNNRPFTSQVKLVKVDEESGKAVTLNSASFKIKDSRGNYVVQKVAGIKIDTFTTNSKSQVVTLFGTKGEVTLPLELDAGAYSIEEVKVPDGFLELKEPITFTITNIHDYDIDEDEIPILIVKIKNAQPHGKLVIKKTDKVTADPLENVEYELTAKENIINAIDGSVIYKKGETVSEGKTNAQGLLEINNLPMGHYLLKETLANEGYVLSKEIHDVIFKQKDTVMKEYIVNVNMTNIKPYGEIHLEKTDTDTKEVLGGVTFQLTAKENIYSLDGRNVLLYKAGDTVSKDISENGLYVTDELGQISISKLPLGHYELKEIQTLEGYVPNDAVYDIDLNYNHTDKIIYTENINVENTKTRTEISKIDATDEKELPGAHLSLKDKDGNIVEEWISRNESHIIRGLLVNEEYTLHEDLAPIGYVTANDVKFTVNDEGTTTKVTMKDEITKIDISKVDATTEKEIDGAKLTVTDKETGKVIETWTSGKAPHRIEGLEVSKIYILHEDLAPVGYKVASDVEFTIADTGEVQKVIMKDERKPTVVKTGDDMDVYTIVVLTGASLLLAVALIVRIRSKHNEKK